MMPRVVTAEALDHLSALDPAAISSRRDLQRIHRLLGSRAWLLRPLRAVAAAQQSPAPLRLLELGAGDGSLLLGVAQALPALRSGVELTLLDRQPLLTPTVIQAYAAVGWTAVAVVGDVNDWAAANRPQADPAPPSWDCIVANLFLHHFAGTALTAILSAAAHSSRHFLAFEPRRDRITLAASHLLGLLGMHPVTRQDAVLSVHAGFCRTELTALWPQATATWTTAEQAAGWFSHGFSARRQVAP